MTYRDFVIEKTGSRAWDYMVKFPQAGRVRFGTVAELKADIDAFYFGSLPERGKAA